MATQHLNVLNQEDIDLLLNLPDVISAKAAIDAQTSGSVSLSVPLPASIKDALRKNLSLDLFGLSTIPMRWIKGDTSAHKDSGAGAFQNTYLVYLTDSQGELIVDGASYKITQGTGYVFPEGLSHETLNTGSEPRLLLGPMSETGFAVGSGIYRPGGTTIYFRQTGVNIEYSIDDKASWIGIGNNFPIVIGNTDTSAGTLIVEFVGNITIDDNVALGIYKYFICGSSHIQFGSKSLNPDGSRSIINIDGVIGYEGFIQNSYGSGNNIYIYNLIINALNGSTLANIFTNGWLCRANFAISTINNYIINCSLSGESGITTGSLVGFRATQNGGRLYIYGCSSSVDIPDGGGGIVATDAGFNGGQVTCEQCWSTGAIGNNGGGIFGSIAGNTGGTVSAIKCYSTGSIGQQAGGIFGSAAGVGGAVATANSCYSLGTISVDSGGIFGGYAGASGGTTSAINCYSAGIITTSGTGIYGTGNTNSTENQCYAANGSWSSSAANSQLAGVPSGGIVGNTWVATVVGEPYELNNMGYTPYTADIITDTPSLNQTFSQTIEAGQATLSALIADASGNNFTILQISGGDTGSYGTITPNQQTGAISTTSATQSGIYTLVIRSLGSYNITIFILTVTGGGGGGGGDNGTTVEVIHVPCCALPSNVTGEDYDIQADTLAGNAIIAAFSARRGPISYTALLKMKIANASKRR